MMTKFHKKKLLSGWLAVCLLAASSCNDHLQDEPSTAINTPLIISAEIDNGQTGGAGTRVAADNSYDLSSFRTGDKMNVICSRAGTRLTSAGYSLGADGSWQVAEGTGLGFLPAITCRAEFPVDYDVVMSEQSTAAAFLKSNLLRTPEVTVTGAEVKFTGAYAFEHQHAKLTLNFEGKNVLPEFKQITLEGTGICSGNNTEDRITMFRPEVDKHSWCAVLNASWSGSSETKVTVVDENNIIYRSEVIVQRVERNKHYIFTISLKNDILYPVGQEIEPWKAIPRYTGGFD